MMATPTEVTAVTPSPDGKLIDRVQQLRLNGTAGGGATGARRGSWLPWVLCAAMAVAWVGLGVRGYRNAEKTDGGESGAKAGAKAPAAPEVPAPGELLLQIKGTLTPFLQINLSPDDVSGVVTDIYFKEGDRVEKDK